MPDHTHANIWPIQLGSHLFDMKGFANPMRPVNENALDVSEHGQYDTTYLGNKAKRRTDLRHLAICRARHGNGPGQQNPESALCIAKSEG